MLIVKINITDELETFLNLRKNEIINSKHDSRTLSIYYGKQFLIYSKHNVDFRNNCKIDNYIQEIIKEWRNE